HRARDAGRPAEVAGRAAGRAGPACARAWARTRRRTQRARARACRGSAMTMHPPLLEPAEAYALWAAEYPAHAHNPVMCAEERAMLALMPASLRGQAVLDAGCGSGRYLLHALRRGAMRATGVDLSPPMLERADAELGSLRTGAQVSLLQGNLLALPVPDAQADLTVCGLVVGHLDNLAQALAELRRVTRPGGILLCSDVHPIGHALGWQRDFKSAGRRYAVRHTSHLY